MPLWPWLYGSWIYNYLCNQCLSPLMWVRISISARCTTLCDEVCRWQVWFSPVSCTNKTDRHDITEILLKVVLNAIKQANNKNHLVEIDFAFPLCWNKNQVEVTLYFWLPTRIFLPFITMIVHENGNICCSVKSTLYHISVAMTTLKSNWIFKIVTFWQLTISGSFYQWVFPVVIVHVLKVMLSYTLCMSLMKQFPYVYCDVIFCNFSLL